MVNEIAEFGVQASADTDGNKLVSLESVAVTIRTGQLRLVGAAVSRKKESGTFVKAELLLWEVSMAFIWASSGYGWCVS